MRNFNESLAKIAKKKSLLREYNTSKCNRTVYLNDGDEFQIQIFNPYSYVIGASIVFNDDTHINPKMLVIRPGERVWLERYLDDDKKMVFSTYEVSNSRAAKEAIRNNGVVRIEFYRERDKSTWIYRTPYSATTSSGYSVTTTNRYMKNSGVFTTDTTSGVDDYYSHSLTAIEDYDDSYVINNSNQDLFCGVDVNYNINNSFTSATAASSIYNMNIDLSATKANANKIETGRIEKGDYSNQTFKYADYDFNYFAFETEVIQILPMSEKPITQADLQKRYCHECGRKLSAAFKYCPHCGTKQ